MYAHHESHHESAENHNVHVNVSHSAHAPSLSEVQTHQPPLPEYTYCNSSITPPSQKQTGNKPPVHPNHFNSASANANQRPANASSNGYNNMNGSSSNADSTAKAKKASGLPPLSFVSTMKKPLSQQPFVLSAVQADQVRVRLSQVAELVRYLGL